MLRVALFLLLLSTAVAADGFSANRLEGFVYSPAAARGTAIAQLSDGSFVIVGTVRYPANYVTHPGITNSAPITAAEDTAQIRSAALILRYGNGGVQWATRVALCKEDAHISVTVDDKDDIYVAGSTTGLASKQEASVFLAKLSMAGSLSSLTSHDTLPGSYTWLKWTLTHPSMIFLVRQAPPSSKAFATVANPPTNTGLVVARATRDKLILFEDHAVSQRDGDRLAADHFWDACVAPDGTALYIAAKRQTVGEDWTHTFTPTVFDINMNDLRLRKRKSLPQELQNRMSITYGAKGVYVAYVARVNNREQVAVRRMGVGLESDNWGNGEAEFYRHVQQDKLFTRTSRTDVYDITVDEAGVVRLLLYAAEILDRDAPDVEVLRQLGNGRPGIMVIMSDMSVQFIRQSSSESRTLPNGMLVTEKEYSIVGSDEEGGTLLMLGVEREVLPSPTPSPKPKPSSGSNNPGDDGDVSGNGDGGGRSSEPKECVGLSSRVGHKTFLRLVKERRMRVQWHPLRMFGRDVEMLCIEDASDVLCATSWHIVRFGGQLMYMRELCTRLPCVNRLDTPVNFKSSCGTEINIANVSVTMHTGSSSQSAVEAANAECWQQRRNPALWLVSTL